MSEDLMAERSFFETAHSPYYIYTVNFTHKSAGIRALHHLCHALNVMGAEAYLLGCTEESNFLRTPILRESDVLRHQKLNILPIVVYPEIISGNPLHMPYVTRWLLNQAGHLGGDDNFDDSDLLFAFSDHYVSQSKDIPILSVPLIDSSIFNNPKEQVRQGYCFYANKYLAKGGILTEHASRAVSLGQEKNLTPYEIAAILRRSEILYCYEPTALIGEALRCGCPVIMIDTPFLRENLSSWIEGKGVCLSSEPNAEEIAKKTIDERFEDEEKLITDCWHQVGNFILKTRTFFKKKSSEYNQDWCDYILKFISQKGDEQVIKTHNRRGLQDKKWLQKNTLQEGQAAIMAERMVTTWHCEPTFHLIMVINQYELNLLPDTLDSLQQQLYGGWGLTILSNISQPEIFNDIPENIEWIELTGSLNEHINKTITEAELDWVLEILPGDKLVPQALLSFSESINQHAQARFIYSDENTDGLLFKPDFNLELLRSSSYIGRAAIVRRDSLEILGGFSKFAYLHTTDLAFQVYEQFGESAIEHIADILYIGSATSMDEELLQQNELTVRYNHFLRSGISAQINPIQDKRTFHMIYLYEDEPLPLVSIIIANKNNANSIARCVEELIQNIDDQQYELILVDQESDVDDIAGLYQEFSDALGERFKCYSFEKPNYSAMINYGVEQASGEYIVILSNTALTLNGDWLPELLSLVRRKDVGAVGSRILNMDQNVVYGGGVLGATDDVRGMFAGQAVSDSAYMDRAHLVQQYSILSSACLMVNIHDFKSVGGLDETHFANSRYCIADFCLKIGEMGLKNIWTPYATLSQFSDIAEKTNGVSSFVEDVEANLLERWPEPCRNDQYYNCNLSLRDADYSVDVNAKISWDQRYKIRPHIMVFPFNNLANSDYRVRAPLRVLEHQGLIETIYLPNHEGEVTPFVPNRFELHRAAPDIILLQNTLNDVFLDFIEKVKSETSITVIAGLDDLVDNMPKKSASRTKAYRDARYRLRRMLKWCDRFIVSTRPLAEAYADLSDEIVVIPNRLEYARWAKLLSLRDQSDKPRVGWAGAQQHLGDLEIIIDVVKETAQEIDWVFFGMCPDELIPYVKEVHSYVAYEEYPEKLASLYLDLAVAPLEDNPFNRAKSNLRILEYGILGWPVICSDVYPYKFDQAPVMRVSNNKEEWLLAIREGLSNKDALTEKGKKLRNWVSQNYILEANVNEWLNALEF